MSDETTTKDADRPGARGGAVVPDCDLCRDLCRVFRWSADIVALVHVHEAHDRLRAPALAAVRDTNPHADAAAHYDDYLAIARGWSVDYGANGGCPECGRQWCDVPCAHLSAAETLVRPPAPGAADERAREDAGLLTAIREVQECREHNAYTARPGLRREEQCSGVPTAALDLVLRAARRATGEATSTTLPEGSR